MPAAEDQGDSSRQQQMLASMEKEAEPSDAPLFGPESDNEGVAAYLLHCPWEEVIFASVSVCIWKKEDVSFEIKARSLSIFISLANVMSFSTITMISDSCLQHFLGNQKVFPTHSFLLI